MRIQLTGRIVYAEEKLGRHAKTPIADSRTKKKKKWQKFEKMKDVAPNTSSSATSLLEAQRPSFKHLVLLSFPSSEEYERYLASKERKNLEETVGVDGVNDGMVVARRLMLPPKNRPICKNDWAFGNPHQPAGQDWFG
jgi:hypothetical protein